MVKMNPEFHTAFESFLQTKGLDVKTIHSYMFFYHKYLNLYSDLNQKNIDLFLQHNQNAPARAMFVNLKSALMRWDIPLEVKQEVSIFDIPKKSTKDSTPIPKFIKKSDIDRLDIGISTKDPLKDEKLKLLILIQFYGGLRLNELIHISYNDLDKEHWNKESKYQQIKIKSESAKFGKERVAYIPTEIYVRALRWIANNVKKNYQNKPFSKEKPMWDMKKSSYKKLLAEWSLKILGEAYNSHSLRHGRGYDLKVVHGKDIDFVKEYLGHSTIMSTQRYIHMGNKEVKDELEKGLD